MLLQRAVLRRSVSQVAILSHVLWRTFYSPVFVTFHFDGGVRVCFMVFIFIFLIFVGPHFYREIVFPVRGAQHTGLALLENASLISKKIDEQQVLQGEFDGREMPLPSKFEYFFDKTQESCRDIAHIARKIVHTTIRPMEYRDRRWEWITKQII